jgi:bifunctional non-homologous end joining protein LigD
LDGELVVLDDKQQSNFQLLQNSIKAKQANNFIYYIFDLIYLDKQNLSTLPLLERKKILKKIMEKNSFDFLQYSEHIIGNGKPLFKNACKLGLEGIISKNINSQYAQKRSTDWLKIKCTKSQEFIIAGFTPPQGSRNYFGSLVLATYNNKKELIYHGNVGTGFTQASLKDIHSKLQKYQSDRMPFKQKPPASNKVTWVKPVLVAEVEFSEWTTDNSLRHPSFKGLRADKKPASIHKEKVCRLKKR